MILPHSTPASTARLALLSLAVLTVFANTSISATPFPPDRPIEEAVDHFIDARLKTDDIKPAPPTDDATILRRTTLDLVGRVPTPTEMADYVASKDPAKRVALVERLLASPGYVRHTANEFDAVLMAGTKASVREYLQRAFAEGKPWDRIFRELITADESDPGRKGSTEFIRSRIADLDKVTTDVSVAFFGVNVSCAKCHDHPLVHDWKQDHFYGLKSFFSRTFDNGGQLAEREYGLVKFATTKGQNREAKLMFLTGKVIDAPNLRDATSEEQKRDKERLEQAKKNKVALPAPAFSARGQLAEVALQEGQRDFFARSVVNRLILRLYGQGLVMPVDQMHSENPASHPELLQWLADDLVTHQYDLKRLTRGLVLSRAYARSSRWESDDTPAADLYAVAKARPLTPAQFGASLRVATTDPMSLTGLKPEDFEKRMETLEQSGRGLGSMFGQPGEDVQIGVSEALLFSNSARIQQELFTDGGDRIVGRLKQLKDVNEIVELTVRSVLSRPATDGERKLLGEYLRARGDRPIEACKQVTWALLTSPEFRFNH